MDLNKLSFYKRSTHEEVAIIRVPFELGSDERGLAETPIYLFENGIEKILDSIGCVIKNIVDVHCPSAQHMEVSTLKNAREFAIMARETSTQVKKATLRGDIVAY